MSTYTETQVKELNEMYDGNNAELPNIAKHLGKTVHSVRAKLVAMGNYKKPAKAEKNENAGQRKSDLVEQLMQLTNMPAYMSDALSKTTKEVLLHLIKAVEEEEEPEEAKEESEES